MSYVPQEVVTEILLRLPVTSLIKCLCVCKDWYSLIKSARFVDLHLNHPSTNNNRREYMISWGIRFRGKSAFWYYSLDSISGTFLPMPDPLHLPGSGCHLFKMCGPCNGIFCIVSSPSVTEETIYLCNPATRESHRLPRRPLGRPFPSVQTTAYGLGFDPCTNDYKVFSVLHCEFILDGRGPVYQIGIYNLSYNSWIEAEMALPDSLGMSSWFGKGLLFNGRLHWKLWRIDLIVWFDIANEDFGLVHLPPDVAPGNMSNQSVVVLEDCLALAVIATPADLEVETCSISIWKMMDCGGKDLWMKRFSVSIPLSREGLHPIGFSKDDVLLLLQKISIT